MPTGVRMARTSDVDHVAAVQVAAWQSLYGSVLDTSGISLDPMQIAESWAAAILQPPAPTVRVLVATEDNQVIGFAATGPCLDPDLPGDCGEIHALVVDPRYFRRGHGSRLMAACVDHLRACGFTSAVTWTPLGDEPRRAFWQSAGWAPDSARHTLGTAQHDPDPGQHAGPDQHASVTEVRLVVEISPDP